MILLLQYSFLLEYEFLCRFQSLFGLVQFPGAQTMIYESKLTHTYSYKQFHCKNCFISHVYLSICVCVKPLTTIMLNGTPGQFFQNLNDLEMLKYYHLGLYIKKSLPTLVALNYSLMNATMPVLLNYFTPQNVYMSMVLS